MNRALICAACLLLVACDDTDGDLAVDGAMAEVDGTAEVDVDPPPDGGMEQTAFELAVAAIGGPLFLEATSTLVIEAEGDNSIDYGALTPEEVHPTNTYRARYSFDFAADAQRQDVERTLGFGALQFIGEQRFSLIMQGRRGVLTAPAGFAEPGAMPSQQVAARRMKQRFFNPHVYLREALADPALVTVTGEEMLDGRPHAVLAFPDPVSDVHLLVDAETGVVARLRTMANHPLVRDIEIEVEYRDWTDSDGGRYPTTVELFADGLTIQVERRSSFVAGVDLPAETFAFPDGEDGGAVDEMAYGFGQTTAVAVDAFFGLISYMDETSGFQYAPVAPGLGMLAGAANTMVLEHEGGLVVIEAAGSPARGEALVADIEARYPDQPITHIVQSHHHYDHAAGVRAFAAAGAAVVTGHTAGSLWEEVLSAPSTIRPDRLSRADVEPRVIEIESGGAFELSDGLLDLTVHHLDDDAHSADMVLPVFDIGGVRYVYVTDHYNAGFGLTILLGGPTYFFEKMRSLGLIDEACEAPGPLMIIPSHGRPQSLQDSIAELAGLEVPTGCP